MGILKNLLENQNTVVAGVVLVMVSFNTLITVLKKIMDRFAPASRADSILGKAGFYAAKAVEFLSANSTVLPQSAQTELKAAEQAQK